MACACYVLSSDATILVRDGYLNNAIINMCFYHKIYRYISYHTVRYCWESVYGATGIACVCGDLVQ